MSYWRTAGVTYLRYSSIAAKQVRQAIKKDVRPDESRAASTIKKIKVEAKS